MRVIDASKTGILVLGYQGEDQRLEIRFPLVDEKTGRNITEEFPGGSFSISIMLPGDPAEHIVGSEDFRIEGSWLIWTVKEPYTVGFGEGKLQLNYAFGGMVKSRIWKTNVRKSINSGSGTVPSWSDWKTELLTAAAAVQSAVDSYNEMSAEAEELPAGSTPTAEMDHTGEHPVLKLGIPASQGGGGGAVQSVNGKTGVVVLNANDVGALPATTPIPPAVTVDSQLSGTSTNPVQNKVIKAKLDEQSETIVQLAGTVSGKYAQPLGGIPSTDMSEAVQTSLGKADTAIQEHQDISGKQNKPSAAGTAGQVLGLDNNLNPVWLTPQGGGMIVDDQLSESSTNPVQNKVITGVIKKVTEDISATVANAVSLSNLNGAYGLKRDSIADGVATYTPSSSPNVNPSIRDLCELGTGYRIVSLKYKVTKTDQSLGDPQRFTLILGSSENHYFPVKYDEWIYVQIFTNVNLTRVYFMLENYSAAVSSGITLQVKDYYVYNIADIHGEMLFNIISKQKSNFQDGTVNYSFTTKLDSGFVNAQEHGVKGNGTDDDTDMINALFRSFSGRIYFPAGTYKLSGTIEIMGNTEVFGDGESTVFKMDAFDNMILMPYRNTEKTIPYIMTQSDNVTIRKIKLVGNTSVIKAEMHWGIGIYDSDGVRVSGVIVSDINYDVSESVNAKIGYGISARYGNDVIIEDCNVQRCGYECIGLFDGCTHSVIRDNYTQDGKRTCIQVHRGCSNILVDNNYMKQTHNKYDAGLTIHGLASTNETIYNLKITNNTLECTTNGAQADNENAPFQIMSDSQRVNISNNHIFGGKRALYIGGTIDEVIVSGNVMNCNSSSDYGIHGGGTHGIYVGNIMDNDAQTGNEMFESPILVGNIGIGS